MQDYRIELDVYHGPLDLLLYLIRRDEIDLNNLPIHRITEQYLRYVETLKQLDINLAGEFLVMAASLVEVKSVMIAPRDAIEEADDDARPTSENPEDPRYELVQQLLAYKRFKDAARALDDRRAIFAERFPRHPAKQQRRQIEQENRPELDLDDVSIWDLLEAFTTLMDQVGGTIGPRTHDVFDDDTPIELHQDDIVDRLNREGRMTLQQMFVGRRSVSEMLGLFIAMLELIRQQRVRAKQERLAGEIHVELVSDAEREAEAEADDTASQWDYDPTNPDNFAWPDENLRQRYERRIARRAAGEAVEEDEELEADIRELEAEEASTQAADDEPRDGQ